MEKKQLSENAKQSLMQNFQDLRAFGSDPQDKNKWSRASSAIGELGNISVKYLAGHDIEDIPFSSSMTRLSEAVEDLHRSPDKEAARQDYELALGDIRYRIRRIFGVVVE